jgi:hypothetical protein
MNIPPVQIYPRARLGSRFGHQRESHAFGNSAGRVAWELSIEILPIFWQRVFLACQKRGGRHEGDNDHLTRHLGRNKFRRKSNRRFDAWILPFVNTYGHQ